MKNYRLISAAACLLVPFMAAAQSSAPLKPMTKYRMPDSIHGRFDHLGGDLRGNRLFLAAEGAHEVPVFDLRTGKYIRAIKDIEIPHAILVRQDINRIYVTDGGAGALKIYDGKTYRLLKTMPLKVDADSIAYDPASHYLYVVNGGGDAHETFSMVSIVDTTRGQKIADIKIDGDTLEAMALESSSHRMYVNDASKNLVAVIDRKTRSQVASWPVTMGKHNVAMALDETNHRLFVACRSGEIVVFDTKTGKELQSLAIGKGVDDLIFDPATKRIYASCGAAGGTTFVYEQQDPDHYKLLAQVPTGPGGKNELLVPQLKRYFVIVPPQAAAGEVFVFKVE